MTKATFVKKAQKDYPESGIKKGDSYWHWAFAFGPKYKSKTKPTRSQLTRSNFYQTLYALEDALSDRFKEVTSTDDIQSALDELISEIEELRDETQGSLDNMPSQLQDADSGQLLQERIEGLESWLSDLQAIDVGIDDDLKDEDLQERIENIIEEITATSSGL
jgi:chromosome segregation ATPase